MSKKHLNLSFPSLNLIAPAFVQAGLRTNQMVNRANEAADSQEIAFKRWRDGNVTRGQFSDLRNKFNRIAEVLANLNEIQVEDKEAIGDMVAYNNKVGEYFKALGDMILHLNKANLKIGRDLFTTINKLFNNKNSKQFLFKLLERLCEQFNRVVSDNGNPAGWVVDSLRQEERPRCPQHSFWTKGFVPK